MLVAITRKVSPSIGRCELTHLERQAIDVNIACAQHLAYEHKLAKLGCQVHSLPTEPELPDSVFVEDTAIVLDEVAIITRPGAASRIPEIETITRVLTSYRKLLFIQPPGTLDGGDVLCLGKTLYIGLSSRSNLDAIEQVRSLLEPYGYIVVGVNVAGVLHLKSAVTQVAKETLLINPAWASKSDFIDYEFIEIDPSEPYASNALLISDTVIYPTSFTRTRKRLERSGIELTCVAVSELAKAEGAVTCCSLIFNA
jgi:dimethylargininase